MAIIPFLFLLLAGAPPAADLAAEARAAYARVLAAHVDERGRVDYAALSRDDADLEAFTDWVGSVGDETLAAWPEPTRLAFWINAYNAHTLRLILDHYPIRGGTADGPANSILQIPGNWDGVRFETVGRKQTLDQIEHETIRKRFREPGVHVALVCAAVGCPPLLAEPFDGARLADQLAGQARRYLASPAGLEVDPEGRVLRLSAIFDWFGGDFVADYGEGTGFPDLSPERAAVCRYVQRFGPPAARALLASGDFRLEFLDYDWALNDR